jgi:hypothetical protein
MEVGQAAASLAALPQKIRRDACQWRCFAAILTLPDRDRTSDAAEHCRPASQ